MNTYKPRHCQALCSLGTVRKGTDSTQQLNKMFEFCTGADVGLADRTDDELKVVSLLAEHRILFSFLTAVSSSPQLFSRMRGLIANVLVTISDTVQAYHTLSPPTQDTAAAEYQRRWGEPTVGPSELRRRFLEDIPDALDDPLVTGAFLPGLFMCRPSSFSRAEPPELGTCAKNYQEVHQHFSPGIFTSFCACAHPKVIGFVVLDKREGPAALLNNILSYCALLPNFVVYDFGCGALRSALGKLLIFGALVVLVADLFHIVNHLCSDALHPRSYTGMDGTNTVAHEQRNAPINLMRRSLRACRQYEYVAILQLENILCDVMAHARSTSTSRLPVTFNYRQFYFSRNDCPCGCGYHPSPHSVPVVAMQPDAVDAAHPLGVGVWVEGEEWRSRRDVHSVRFHI